MLTIGENLATYNFTRLTAKTTKCTKHFRGRQTLHQQFASEIKTKQKLVVTGRRHYLLLYWTTMILLLLRLNM